MAPLLRSIPAEIRDKRTAYELFWAGEFGNRPRYWQSIDDWVCAWLSGEFEGNVSIRYLKPGSNFQKLVCLPTEVFSTISQFLVQGADQDLFTIHEAPDDGHRMFQGELERWPDGWYLRYSTLALPMRDAFKKEELHAVGIRAWQLVKQHMDATSWDWLQELLDRWPDHVIEFSSFQKSVGVLRWNTIFWEVRLY